VRRRELIFLLGGALTAARGLRAQQKATPVIGYLSSATPAANVWQLPPFRAGLKETGWDEGQNVAIEYRWAEDHYDRLPALAADLVGRRVDVIVSTGGITGALAAKNATSAIPIVFFSGDDPVERGLVTSLAKPGGNLTGVSFLTNELTPKRLELILDLAPHAKVISLLLNPRNAGAERVTREMQDAVRTKRVQLHVLKAGTESEIDAAFATVAQLQTEGLIVASYPYFASRRDQLVTLTARGGVPAIYERREFAEAGGLISYGPSFPGTWHQLGIYAGKILKGEKPAELPVQQPTTFELVVNLKTAGALGLTVPPSILARANEVIE
jgi:putative tryptophan/tyrosine transport system substrate-binding protein